MKSRKNFILPVIGISLAISAICLSGCATGWAVHDYEMVSKYSRFTGPAYGDTTKLYVQGKQEVYRGINVRHMSHWETYPVYMVVEFHNGKIKSISKPQIGDLPSIALEYPEVKPLNTTGNIPNGSVAKNAFIQSGWDSGSCYRTFFIKNPNNVNMPFEIPFDGYSKRYRSVWGYVSLPFVFSGAVVVDVITSPLQLWFYYTFKGIELWHP